jgi:nucleoid-associated protein YgaU
MSKLSSFFNQNRFAVISWAVTLALVAGMIGGALRWKQTSTVQALAPFPTAGPEGAAPEVEMPDLAGAAQALRFIERNILMKTNIPADKPRYDIVEYRVVRGDSVFAIAESFKVQPETVLWANYDVLQDDPHSLSPGQVLTCCEPAVIRILSGCVFSPWLARIWAMLSRSGPYPFRSP